MDECTHGIETARRPLCGGNGKTSVQKYRVIEKMDCGRVGWIQDNAVAGLQDGESLVIMSIPMAFEVALVTTSWLPHMETSMVAPRASMVAPMASMVAPMASMVAPMASMVAPMASMASMITDGPDGGFDGYAGLDGRDAGVVEANDGRVPKWSIGGLNGNADGYDEGFDGLESKQGRNNCKRRSRRPQK